MFVLLGNSYAQGLLYAEKFPGKDAGEKIANCIAALPQSGGVCDARSFSGEQRSGSGFTVGTAAKPVELLLGAIDLMVEKPIYIQAKSSIAGLPSSQGIGFYQGATLIRATNNTNLPVVVEIVGGLAVLQDVTVDGNRKNNPTGGVAIRVNSANRSNLFRVTAQNASGDGIEIYSQKASESCCARLQQIMSVDNGGSGLVIRKTGDIFVSLSEFEGNGDHGIEIDGGAGNRIEHSDIGGNRGDGILLHGTRTLPASQNIILGNQFGNNYQADLAIAGWNGGPSSNGNLIASNEFVGGGLRDGGKYDSIRVTDSGDNVVANNAFFAG
ncbi:MAG TPA: right-handed parallel beta-helix repeat-containing protein, partial [Candidatus Angelobacter sp.]|nr:right-handed parallel beta-helix repeat-containing protein [Candidatus Angelobacter sp.]